MTLYFSCSYQKLLHSARSNLWFGPQRIRMEAHAKFAVLWHLTRDLHINKSSSFGRTFDRLVIASVIQLK